ncbi:MAG: hypothetical protein H6657_14620 [Ardenticatenaceae bacterium]|nr:hypothetical protein [Ardenticatenaceae bacterium]
MSEKPKESTNISGNIQGGMINIGGSQSFQGTINIRIDKMHQAIDKFTDSSDFEKQQIRSLIKQLHEALSAVPPEHGRNVEKIAKRAEELVDEASDEELDRDAIEAKANLLKKAAENVKEIMPIVASIATNLVVHILNLGS